MKRAKSDFSLRQLEVFVHVVDLGSFSRAGDAVLLSQPTISEHVAALENTFGVTLLDRLPGKVVATRAGRVLYDYAQRMLVLQRDAMHAVQDLSQALRGSLGVGGSTIPGVYLLPRLIREYRAIHPDVKVSLHVADTAEIVDELLDGKIELGVVGGAVSHRYVDCRELADDKMVLIAPVGHRWTKARPVDLKDLMSEPFVMRERGSATRRAMEEALAARGISASRDLQVSCEVASTEAVKEAVRAGLGVSIVSERAVELEVRHGTLVLPKFTALDLTRKFHLVVCTRRTPSVPAERFLEFLNGPNGQRLLKGEQG